MPGETTHPGTPLLAMYNRELRRILRDCVDAVYYRKDETLAQFGTDVVTI